MTFSAFIRPADIDGVRSWRYTQQPGRFIPGGDHFVVLTDLRNGDTVALDAEDPAATRAYLLAQLAALDAIDPAAGDQDNHRQPWPPEAAEQHHDQDEDHKQDHDEQAGSAA